MCFGARGADLLADVGEARRGGGRGKKFGISLPGGL